MIDKYVIAASEKSGEEAIKEISLRIKDVFPRVVPSMLLFFTPHYDPETLIQTLQYILKPQSIIGISAPSLIHQTHILEKGIVACCLSKENSVIKGMTFKETGAVKIESALRIFFKDLPEKQHSLISFLPPQISPLTHIRGVELSMGKAANVYGAGFIKRFSFNHNHIIDNQVTEDTISIIAQNIHIHCVRVTGFLPMGKPFIITRTITNPNMILEINNQPAIDIYKHFFEEKFETLRKNRLFSFYPIGIKDKNETRLINIINCLNDGSIACMGSVSEGSRGHIMMLHPESLFEAIRTSLTPLQTKNGGPVFIINSLIRKKILKNHAESELLAVQSALGGNYCLFGAYSDYSLFPDVENKEIGIEAGNLLLTFWQ